MFTFVKEKNIANDESPPSTVGCNFYHRKLTFCHSPRNKCRVTVLSAGFTLVELSIVLVIIGLIVGGVLVGRDLIKASEIRSQISQIEQFKTAANTFKLKYGYLPGDIPPTETASLGFFTFTGTYAGKSYFWFINASLGSLRYGYGNNSGDTDFGESYAFWQHLSEAKMIKGQYGGTSGGANYIQANTTTYSAGGQPVNPTPNQSDLDIFMPQSKFAATDNHIYLGANLIYTKLLNYTKTSLPNYFHLRATPNQEFAIDSKIDDGSPDKGIVRDSSTGGGTLGLPPCVITPYTPPPYVYDLSRETADTPNACMLAILW
jgi:prepilin-type N-terminal cleavage/methylation domain-containing protein